MKTKFEPAAAKIIALVGVLAFLGGCGSSEDYDNVLPPCKLELRFAEKVAADQIHYGLLYKSSSDDICRSFFSERSGGMTVSVRVTAPQSTGFVREIRLGESTVIDLDDERPLLGPSVIVEKIFEGRVASEFQLPMTPVPESVSILFWVPEGSGAELYPTRVEAAFEANEHTI